MKYFILPHLTCAPSIDNIFPLGLVKTYIRLPKDFDPIALRNCKGHIDIFSSLERGVATKDWLFFNTFK